MKEQVISKKKEQTVKKFKIFEMKDDETIDKTFVILTVIVNKLQFFEKTYIIYENVIKIPRSLSKI